jgi:hypothetical protein
MAEEFQKSMASVIDHFKSIMTDVSESYNKAKAEIVELDKYVELKKREREEYNEMISKLQRREELLIQKEENLKQREDEMKREQDEGRKVSIIKNIQTQLHHKINELELANKQKDFYRRQSDILNQLLTKYNITSGVENVSLEQIELVILSSKIVETTVPSIIEIPDSISMMPIRKESHMEETESAEAADAPAPELEPDKADEEEQTEVEDFEYRGKMYYIDRSTGDIYAKLEDDEVGDIIGHLEIINSKQKVSWNKKSKK